MQEASQRDWPSRRNLQDDRLAVYVRRARRIFDGELSWCVDIGSVNVIRQRDEGKGYFRDFITWLEANCPENYIYIENVLNPRLEIMLEKHGYKVHQREQTTYPYSWFKRIAR